MQILNTNIFSRLVEYNPTKQEVSRIVILPLEVSIIEKYFCSRFKNELAYSCERKQSTLLTRRSHQGLRSSDFITHYKTNSINVLQVGRKKLTSTNQFGSSRASHRRWKCLMCSRRYQSVPVRVLKGTLFTLCNLAMTRYNSKFRQIF